MQHNLPFTTTKSPDNSMHDGDILAPDIIHHHLSYFGIQAAVPEEQQVSTLESRFHTSGEDDYDGRSGVGCDTQAFPEHKGCAEDEGEV